MIIVKPQTLVIFGIILISLITGGCSRQESVQEFGQRQISMIDKELLDPNNAICKRIEAAHITVTAKSAKVTQWQAQTIDGSNNAGKNGSNIGDIDMVITVIWDGLLQKDGFTEIEILYDNQNKRTKATKYLRSSALVNWENVDWKAVGFVIGQYIAASL